MKKVLFLIGLGLLSVNNLQAQEGKPYNRWSVDINGGLSRPTQPFVVGNYVKDFSLFHVDGGVRYMFNTKVGLKADFGYDSYEGAQSSMNFDGTYTRVGLQGVVNLGRVLSFEEFAKWFNLQLHTGLGYSYMETNNFGGKDEMLNVPLGLTAQFKLGNRVAFNADFTMINNISQHYTFDGKEGGAASYIIEDRGFNSTLYNATLGLSIYLGKQSTHADWYFEDNSKADSELENRLAQLEEKIKDSDNDGVADYLDQEPNTPSGYLVDTKGRALDKNQNGIPDSYETYINQLKNNNQPAVSSATEGVSFEEMINNGYLNVYFPFNSTTPTESSYDAINFVTDYLKSNPSKAVELTGYADVIGNDSFNNNLSTKRSEIVKSLISKAGVDASRMTVKGQGEDNKFGDSSVGRALVRRVTFKLK